MSLIQSQNSYIYLESQKKAWTTPDNFITNINISFKIQLLPNPKVHTQHFSIVSQKVMNLTSTAAKTSVSLQLVSFSQILYQSVLVSYLFFFFLTIEVKSHYISQRERHTKHQKGKSSNSNKSFVQLGITDAYISDTKFLKIAF